MNVLNGLSRRGLLRIGALGGVGTAILAACGETTEIIKEIPVEVLEEVEVAGETVIKEVQVEVPVEVIKEVEKIVEVEVAGETTVVEKIVEVQAEVVTTKVNFWFNSANQQKNFEEKVVGHYHRQQDLYRLEVTLVPANEQTTKLTAAIAGGAPPDGVRVGGGTLANTFFRSGAMHDIDQFDPTVKDSDIVPAVKVTPTWGDKMWAMPVNSGTNGLFYNRSLYDAAGIADPPTTFTEMVENAGRIQSLGAVGGDPVFGQVFASKPNQQTAALQQGFLFGFGAFAVDESGTKATYDS